MSLKVSIASESDKEAEMLELASGVREQVSRVREQASEVGKEASRAGNAASEGKGDEGASHVLTLLDKFEHRGPNGVHSVIVTDVVAPLLSFHTSRRLPRWRKVAAYGLAKAVAQLHAAGVVHGGELEFIPNLSSTCLCSRLSTRFLSYLSAGRPYPFAGRPKLTPSQTSTSETSASPCLS